MSEIIPLNSQIFTTGTKFIVTENTKDSTFGPGTTGFMSYVKGHDQDYPNVVYLQTVILKRGKNGKKRLDKSELSTPVFDINDENMAKVMPEEKRRYYVHIEPVIPFEKDVMNMINMDFIGWAHCQAIYINKLSRRSNLMNSWPEDSDHYLNKILNINEYFTEDIANEYSEYEFRRKFIHIIRKLESTLVKSALIYMMKLSEIEKRAIYELCAEGLNIGNPDIMKKTQSKFDERLTFMYVLGSSHGKKNVEETIIEFE